MHMHMVDRKWKKRKWKMPEEAAQYGYRSGQARKRERLVISRGV
jgi:hypothetical protein